MKQRWLWGTVVAVSCAAWFVFAPTRVTAPRVRALVAELGPLVEAETGGSLGEDLRTEVLTQEELRAHFEALNIANGDYVPTPAHTIETETGTQHMAASTDWDALKASMGLLALYDPRDRTIRVCSTNLDAAAGVIDLDAVELLTVVLLHELVHAVDGRVHGAQWIENASREDEQARAASTVLEGHAALIARRIAARLEFAEAAQAWEAHWAESWGFYATYLRSADYLERVEREGGRAAIDAALMNSPETIDEVLYPDLVSLSSTPASRELALDAALFELAEHHGDCAGPRLRDAPRHEFEARIYRDHSVRSRSLASTLVQHVELRGSPADSHRDDVPYARASVFIAEEAAEEYLHEAAAQAEFRVEIDREMYADLFESGLDEHAFLQRPLFGEGWEGVVLARRWTFTDSATRLVEGHLAQAGELELRHVYARRGRVVIELLPVTGDGGPLAPIPHLDAAFALIDTQR